MCMGNGSQHCGGEGESAEVLHLNTVSIPLLQARLRGPYSPWTPSVFQTSLGLAKEAQLIGLWSTLSMLISLQAVWVCVCVYMCGGMCGWAACAPKEGWMV